MHFDNGVIPRSYVRYTLNKSIFLWCLGISLVLTTVIGVSLGAVHIRFQDVAAVLMKHAPTRQMDLIVWNIRLPQTLTAMVAGAGLAGAGTVMQAVLKNPLASPFTLGIAHAAAFGAALSVMVLGSGGMASTLGDAVTISNPALTLGSAFVFSMGTACLITFIARTKGASPEVMVLTGVALGALFTAGTMLLQFFADDVQLAAMVFWTFGDVGRTHWQDLGVLAALTAVILAFFLVNVWNYNAMGVGDETAQGLGVRVKMVRLLGMMGASLVTSAIISYVGIIGFIGLVAPHMVRRVIGDDHRFLLPGSILAGSLILMISDIGARMMLLPHVLPVSIFTAFLGAPVFIYLIIKRS